MVLEHRGKRPRIAASAYVAPNAVVCGDVTIGDHSRILFGAVLTAEGGSVEVGAHCIVMEHALIRGREGHPARLGDHVLVGPHAHVNGAILEEEEAFLATSVAIFPGARVGRRAEVRVNAVVQVNSVREAEATVPIGWIAVGGPARFFPPERHDELWTIQRELDFPETVFGIAREEATMARVTERYTELFGAHRDDRLLEEEE
ncbi:MAG: gamma carbonic anhydrase family protein [Actinomycetota bacterium]|nr:gamma carbonic anhydrase family protein [Actinomycetota bacterium]